MKKFVTALSLFLAVAAGGKASAYHFTAGVGQFHYGWGWYPLTAIGYYPAYGFSYYPYFGYLPYYATFGAIAYSPATGQTGWAWGSATRYAAEAGAIDYCAAPDCRSIVWVQGGCAAVATSANEGQLGWGYDSARYRARSRALRACRASGGNPGCHVKAWVCSY